MYDLLLKTNHHFFFLPLFFKASAMIHCSWPLTERNSSAAHCSTASIVSASTRSRKVLLLVLFSFSFDIVNSFLYVKDVALRPFGWSQGPQAQGTTNDSPKVSPHFFRCQKVEQEKSQPFFVAKRPSKKKVGHFPSPKGQAGKKSVVFRHQKAKQKKSRLFSVAKRPSRKKVGHFPSPKGQNDFSSHPPLSKPILSSPQTPPSPAPDTHAPS